MRARSVVAAVAAALACLLALAGCRSAIGTAATVGGQRISESQVGSYLTPQATPFQASRGNPVIVPKSYVLDTLVRIVLVQDALATTPGGPPSSQDLDRARTTALGGTSIEDVHQTYTSKGFTAALADQDLQLDALILILGDRLGGQGSAQRSSSAVLAYLQKQKVPVSVNPRYGTWSTDSLSVDSSGGPLPFLQLQDPSGAGSSTTGS